MLVPFVRLDPCKCFENRKHLIKKDPVKYIWESFALNLSFLLPEIAIRLIFLGQPLHSAGHLLVVTKVASSIFVNQLNATNLKSSETQFQFELGMAQLNPSLFIVVCLQYGY